MVEEAAAASESMANQSVGLQQLVGQFSIDESYLDQGGAPAPRRAPAPQSAARRPAAPAATRTRPAPAPKSGGGDDWEEF